MEDIEMKEKEFPPPESLKHDEKKSREEEDDKEEDEDEDEDEEDGEDEVIATYDLYLSNTMTKQLYLFQYPNRPKFRPYDFAHLKKFEMKCNHERVKMTFDINKGEHFLKDEEVIRTSSSREVDEDYTPNRKMKDEEEDEVEEEGDDGEGDLSVKKEKKKKKKKKESPKKEAEKVEGFTLLSNNLKLKTTYCVGVKRENQIHLTPITKILNFAPSLNDYGKIKYRNEVVKMEDEENVKKKVFQNRKHVFFYPSLTDYEQYQQNKLYPSLQMSEDLEDWEEFKFRNKYDDDSESSFEALFNNESFVFEDSKKDEFSFIESDRLGDDYEYDGKVKKEKMKDEEEDIKLKDKKLQFIRNNIYQAKLFPNLVQNTEEFIFSKNTVKVEDDIGGGSNISNRDVLKIHQWERDLKEIDKEIMRGEKLFFYHMLLVNKNLNEKNFNVLLKYLIKNLKVLKFFELVKILKYFNISLPPSGNTDKNIDLVRKMLRYSHYFPKGELFVSKSDLYDDLYTPYERAIRNFLLVKFAEDMKVNRKEFMKQIGNNLSPHKLKKMFLEIGRVKKSNDGNFWVLNEFKLTKYLEVKKEDEEEEIDKLTIPKQIIIEEKNNWGSLRRKLIPFLQNKFRRDLLIRRSDFITLNDTETVEESLKKKYFVEFFFKEFKFHGVLSAKCLHKHFGEWKKYNKVLNKVTDLEFQSFIENMCRPFVKNNKSEPTFILKKFTKNKDFEDLRNAMIEVVMKGGIGGVGKQHLLKNTCERLKITNNQVKAVDFLKIAREIASFRRKKWIPKSGVPSKFVPLYLSKKERMEITKKKINQNRNEFSLDF